MRSARIVFDGRLMLDNARLPEHDGRIVGNVLENDAIGANPRVVANTNTAEDLRAGADVDAVPDDRREPATPSDGDLMGDGDVLADPRPPAMTIPLMPCTVMSGGPAKFSQGPTMLSSQPTAMSAQYRRIIRWQY